MTTLEIRQGDTVQLNLNLTENGEPFVPAEEKVVFTLARFDDVLFSLEAEDGVVRIPHEKTDKLTPGTYKFDVRVYNADKTLVATPVVGEIQVTEVVNHDLL
nr:hypothetical protein [uncultured Gemmiger sp.]